MRIHVTSRSGGRWAVRKEDSARALRVFRKKPDAVREAMKYHREGYEVVIHNRDGTVDKFLRPILV